MLEALLSELANLGTIDQMQKDSHEPELMLRADFGFNA